MGDPGPAGFGDVIRDHDSNLVPVIFSPLGMCDSTKLEASTLLLGLRELKWMGAVGALVKGDRSCNIGKRFRSLVSFACFV